jgi:hypothetical protein
MNTGFYGGRKLGKNYSTCHYLITVSANKQNPLCSLIDEQRKDLLNFLKSSQTVWPACYKQIWGSNEQNKSYMNSNKEELEKRLKGKYKCPIYQKYNSSMTLEGYDEMLNIVTQKHINRWNFWQSLIALLISFLALAVSIFKK